MGGLSFTPGHGYLDFTERDPRQNGASVTSHAGGPGGAAAPPGGAPGGLGTGVLPGPTPTKRIFRESKGRFAETGTFYQKKKRQAGWAGPRGAKI